jgi:hypothetical protein
MNEFYDYLQRLKISAIVPALQISPILLSKEKPYMDLFKTNDVLWDWHICHWKFPARLIIIILIELDNWRAIPVHP